MIEGLKRYPTMKDSGVPWLGEVPEHWVIAPPKRALQSRSAGAAPIKNTASPIRREGLFPAFSASGQDVWLPEPMFHGPGLVLSAVGARCGKTFRADGAWSIVANTHVLLVRGGQDRDYWWYVTNDEAWWERAGAAQPFVQVSKTLDRPWAVPPSSEQADIVRFLDRADRRIRRYIRAKQKLVKLLEEQKRAIIHRAVTRGLDPNVRLKPSGVEWLGDVPEHWPVVSLKRVLRQLVDCEHKTAPAVGKSDYHVVRTTAVRNGRLRWSGTYCTSAEAFAAWTRRAVPEPGDVIFTREAPAGEACLVPDGANVCLGQRTVLMKLRRQSYNSRFLVHMIYAGPPRLLIQIASQGSTVGHFNMDDIGWMKVLSPPLHEQESIVASIDCDTASLNEAAVRAEREVDLLREYRTRLIADVVTGKLDVREAAACLHDEVADDEPLGELSAETPCEEATADELDAVLDEAEA